MKPIYTCRWKVPEPSTLSHRNLFSILCDFIWKFDGCCRFLPCHSLTWSIYALELYAFQLSSRDWRTKRPWCTVKTHIWLIRGVWWSHEEVFRIQNQALEPWQRARCQSLAKWIGARCTQDVINGTELLVASRAAGLNLGTGMSNPCQSLSRQLAAAWGEHPSGLQVPRSLSEAHPNREAELPWVSLGVQAACGRAATWNAIGDGMWQVSLVNLQALELLH